MKPWGFVLVAGIALFVLGAVASGAGAEGFHLVTLLGVLAALVGGVGLLVARLRRS